MNGETQTGTEQPVKPAEGEKKSRWWIWLIVILILIAVGIGIYFLVSGGSLPVGGGSIPQPPALPA